MYISVGTLHTSGDKLTNSVLLSGVVLLLSVTPESVSGEDMSTSRENMWISIARKQTYMDVLYIVCWCGGKEWVDQRKKCADICDVAQVTDIRTLPN